MKKLLLLSATLTITGCQSIKHVSGAEFTQELCGLNSFSGAKLIGSGRERAYLEYWNAKPKILGGGMTVHAVKLAELPENANTPSGLDLRKICGN